MKKIIIVGALGYLGTELCKIYSGESRTNKIIAIDNRFISERVTQLKNWDIEFFQGHILDLEFIKFHLKNADIVHHLAGVTDVAYIKKDSNLKLDKKIRSIAVEGTNNILKSISKKCKIIFPSSHVIFEGLKSTKCNINEKANPKPILMYSTSKLQNEMDIKSSGKNYIILRLGSVYGYSSDTMRINIMPNLFSKITSQNGQINLFAAGKQLKSLVSVYDVVRCMKFMEKNIKIKNQTFNLTNENSSVKKVAQICKKINPKIKLKETNDEIPNLGYTLSNKKLLKTGFKFLYKLDDSIKEMILKWKYNLRESRLEEIFKGKNEFKDLRGKIINYELTEPINLVGYIESKKGTVRANHYHPIQEQKCIVVNGQFISIYKDLLDDNSPTTTHIVNKGDLIVTKPNVAHAMLFTKNSVFLNLVRGEREHKNYGITHTIPYELIKNKEQKRLLKIYKFKCRCCGNNKLKRVISLGFQPLANNLIKTKYDTIQKFPLEMNYCQNCSNAQLSVAVDAKKVFSKYLYLSSTSMSLRRHFHDAAIQYKREFKLNKNSYVIDIGSNDGIGLLPLKKIGFKNLLGIEPASNLCKISKINGIKAFNGFLNNNNIKKIKKNADLILASNVFAHADDLEMMAKCMLKLLSKNGVLIIEVQSLMNTIKNLTFDNIYHEHFNYWSLTSLEFFFSKLNVNIFKAKKIKTHGGSLRIYVSKNNNLKKDLSLKVLLKEEEKFGIKKYSTFKKFESKIIKIKKNVKKT